MEDSLLPRKLTDFCTATRRLAAGPDSNGEGGRRAAGGRLLGKMILDEVADGLRRYRMEKDEDKRAKWLEKLAPSRDPRVMVVIGEALFDDESSWVIREAVRIVEEYHDPSIQLRFPLAPSLCQALVARSW